MAKQPMSKTQVICVDGRASVAITRKYSVKQYETVDVHLSVETEMLDGETQSESIHRIYGQLRDDAKLICEEVRLLAQNDML